MRLKKNNSEPIKTILAISVGLLVLYFVFNWIWFLYICLAIGLIGIISDKLTNYFDYIWMKLAWVISLIIPNILLTIIFFFILTPLALLKKIIVQKDMLNLKNDNISLFKEVNNSFDKSSFEKTW